MPSDFALYAARMSALPPTRLATSLRLSVFVDADNIPAAQAGPKRQARYKPEVVASPAT